MKQILPCNKSFIDQAFSVMMAGYWPRSFLASFLASLWTSVAIQTTTMNTRKISAGNPDIATIKRIEMFLPVVCPFVGWFCPNTLFCH